jgi:hypothetical protein
MGNSNEPDRVDYTRLPGDVDQNNNTQAADLIAFRQAIAANFANSPCQPSTDYFDMDRNTLNQGAADLIRFRQLLAGTPPATKVWLGQSVPARP